MLAEHVQMTSLILRVADRDAAADWYANHLGVQVHHGADGHHRVGSFELGGSLISLWERQPGDEPPHGSTSDPYPVVVVSEGIRDLHDELSAKGVTVEPLMRSDLFELFRFRDLDGNVWEISQPAPTN